MTPDFDLDLITDLALRLPLADVRRLARATRRGVPDLKELRASVGSDVMRSACSDLINAIEFGADDAVVAGALLGASTMVHRLGTATAIDVAWTGPVSRTATGRLTSEAIASTLNDARHEILLIGYAVHDEQRVTSALHAAASRGVDITLLLERNADNPRYTGTSIPLAELPARRLAWPAGQRPASGASLHAKVLVVDRHVALVGSANLTGWALARNLECGILVRGGSEPAAICAHVDSLVEDGQLERVP